MVARWRTYCHGDAAGRITIWQAESGQERLVYEVHTKSITSLAWSPNGMLLSSGDLHGYVAVWEALSGKTVYTSQRALSPSEPGANSVRVTWAPNGRFIASGGYEEEVVTIQVLDALTGEEKVTWQCGLRYIAALQWSPEGKYLATGIPQEAYNPPCIEGNKNNKVTQDVKIQKSRLLRCNLLSCFAK